MILRTLRVMKALCTFLPQDGDFGGSAVPLLIPGQGVGCHCLPDVTHMRQSCWHSYWPLSKSKWRKFRETAKKRSLGHGSLKRHWGQNRNPVPTFPLCWAITCAWIVCVTQREACVPWGASLLETLRACVISTSWLNSQQTRLFTRQISYPEISSL